MLKQCWQVNHYNTPTTCTCANKSPNQNKNPESINTCPKPILTKLGSDGSKHALNGPIVTFWYQNLYSLNFLSPGLCLQIQEIASDAERIYDTYIMWSIPKIFQNGQLSTNLRCIEKCIKCAPLKSYLFQCKSFSCYKNINKNINWHIY